MVFYIEQRNAAKIDVLRCGKKKSKKKIIEIKKLTVYFCFSLLVLSLAAVFGTFFSVKCSPDSPPPLIDRFGHHFSK